MGQPVSKQLVKIGKENLEDMVRLIEALAEYEHLDPPGPQEKDRLIMDVLSDRPYFEGYLGILDGKVCGLVIFYFTYSTFKARPILFIEDLFVFEEHRGKGMGRMLFNICAHEAKLRGCCRMEWAVLNWNKAAIDFYERSGGRPVDDLTNYRLDAEGFDR